MAKIRASLASLKAIMGAILLPVGLLLFLANLDEVAAQVSNSFTSPANSISTVMDLGLAGLRAVQAYFFDPSTFQAGVHAILVSLWPLILVIIGATFLQRAVSQSLAKYMVDVSSSSTGVSR